MTEAEWLGCGNSFEMLDFLTEQRKGSGRKLRLFSCGCCRQRMWHLLTDDRSRDAVAVAERYAEGAADPTLLRSAWEAARAAIPPTHTATTSELMVAFAAEATYVATHRNSRLARQIAGNAYTIGYNGLGRDHGSNGLAEWAAQADLIRCIIGNPFRPVSLTAACRTRAVVSLAQAAYDERQLPGGELDPHRLAVLADALEEAGAADELVAHLRSPGPHLRGCHVIDLCLGLK